MAPKAGLAIKAADARRFASIGFSPALSSLRASCALSRASASETTSAEPSPASVALPSITKRKTHRRAPLGETIRYKLSPSPCRPGFAVATARAVSFLFAMMSASRVRAYFRAYSATRIDADGDGR